MDIIVYCPKCGQKFSVDTGGFYMGKADKETWNDANEHSPDHLKPIIIATELRVGEGEYDKYKCNYYWKDGEIAATNVWEPGIYERFDLDTQPFRVYISEILK